MGSKRRKRTAPAIVPRFLKGAVTIGAIPAFAAACSRPAHPQPVVAYFAQPHPERHSGPSDAPRPVQPVVASYVQPPPAVVAAYVPDAGPVSKPAADAAVDAPRAKRARSARKADAGPPTTIVAPPPPPPVVAALVPPPAVVAAYVPRGPEASKPKQQQQQQQKQKQKSAPKRP